MSNSSENQSQTENQLDYFFNTFIQKTYSNGEKRYDWTPEEIKSELNNQGLNVNSRDSDGSTLLLLAAKKLLDNDFMKLASLLLEIGADVNAYDNNKNNVLAISLYGKVKIKIETVKFLVERGVNINEPKSILSSVFLKDESQVGEIVEYLLDNGAIMTDYSIDYVPDFDFLTEYLFTMRLEEKYQGTYWDLYLELNKNGLNEFVKKYPNIPPDDYIEKFYYDEYMIDYLRIVSSPAGEAVYYGGRAKQSLQVMLKHDLDINREYFIYDKFYKYYYQMTLLGIAVLKRKDRRMDMMIKEKDPIRSLLNREVRVGGIDLIKFLLENGADPNQPVETTDYGYYFYNETPLYLAIDNIDYDAVKLLLEYGADPADGSDHEEHIFSLMLYANPRQENILDNIFKLIKERMALDLSKPFYALVIGKSTVRDDAEPLAQEMASLPWNMQKEILRKLN